MNIFYNLKKVIGSIFSVKQNFSQLTDVQLCIGYWDTFHYVQQFKRGNEDSVNPELSKKDALKKYKQTIITLEDELLKRGIKKETIQIIYNPNGRYASFEKM